MLSLGQDAIEKRCIISKGLFSPGKMVNVLFIHSVDFAIHEPVQGDETHITVLSSPMQRERERDGQILSSRRGKKTPFFVEPLTEPATRISTELNQTGRHAG